MPQRLAPLAALALSSLLLACADQAPEQTPRQDEAPEASELPPSLAASEESESNSQAEEFSMNESKPTGQSLEQAVAAAREDLVARTGTPAERISVADARSVTWANGANGCPEAGMMYTQALVEGYYIRLSADGSDYDYHASRDGEPFFCPPERSQRPSSGNSKPEM